MSGAARSSTGSLFHWTAPLKARDFCARSVLDFGTLRVIAACILVASVLSSQYLASLERLYACISIALCLRSTRVPIFAFVCSTTVGVSLGRKKTALSALF